MNIVFLEGFPLDPGSTGDYEQKLSAQDVVQKQSEATRIVETITNPLLDKLPESMQSDAQDSFNNISQSIPTINNIGGR